ncbi:MAG: PAS domain-containing protein [Chloroflexota bacterium]
MLESAPIAILAIDETGRIVYVNRRLEEMFGYAPSELDNQAIERLLPARLRTIHEQHRAD